MTTTAFHYSKVKLLPAIQHSGILDPRCTAMFGAAPDERPILWFSITSNWEQTVNGGKRNDAGENQRLGMEECITAFGGLTRFGYPVRRLQSWKGDRLRRKANMPKEIAKNLETTARKVGANPDDWYGCFHPIFLADLTSIEFMNDEGRWAGRVSGTGG